MMTAGIAATRPIAVASSASAMPGATTARLVVCDLEMPIKLFMMPQTVPNRPTNGDVAPMVASSPMPILIRRPSARTISPKLDAARSLMPSSLEIPADRRASPIAAFSSADSTLSLDPSANCASDSDRASPILRSAPRSLVCTTDNSIIFAKKTVHVTSEANASPIMTALTTISADMNIDHGDNSCSAATVDLNALALLPSDVVDASMAAGAGAGCAAAAGAGAGTACAGTMGAWGDAVTGAAGAGTAGRDGAGACVNGACAGAVVFCWASDGDSGD